MFRKVYLTPLPAVSQLESAGGVDRARSEVLLSRSASASRRRALLTAAGFDGKGTSSGQGEVHPPRSRPGVDVRIAVIDGADRVIYDDAREKAGANPSHLVLPKATPGIAAEVTLPLRRWSHAW